MKKILSACFIVLAAHAVNAQITLTSANNYQIGDKFASQEFDAGSGITLQSLNTPATSRDFSGLTAENSYTNEVIAVPSEDAATYPSANLALKAVKTEKTEYQYYQTTASELINWGYKNTDIGDAVNTDGYKYLQYPFSLNSSFTDNFNGSANITVNSISTTSTRTASVTTSADEESSLVLSGGASYENALRIKTVATITDNITSPLPGAVVTKITSFSWYTQSLTFPVLNIVFSETDLTGVLPFLGKQSQVLYIENSPSTETGIASLELSKNINLFPNPSQSNFMLSYGLKESANVNVKLSTIQGKLVKTLYSGMQSAGDQQISGDVSGLEKGLYFVEISAGEKRQISKLVVE